MNSMVTSSSPNERVARALLHVIIISGGDDTLTASVIPLSHVLQKQIASCVKKSSHPLYTHYIFEILSRLLAQYPTYLEHMDQIFWEMLLSILTNEEQDFMPYALQIVAQFVQHAQILLPKHVQLFEPLVNPTLYTNQRLVPSLIRLICAYLERHGGELCRAGHDSVLLKLFRMLVLSKLTDHEAFNLLGTFTRGCPSEVVTSHLSGILRTIFERLTKAKTTKFVRCLVLYLSLLVVKLEKGPHLLFSLTEGIQKGIFRNLMCNVWLPNLGKVRGGTERKLSLVALGKIVVECTEIGAPHMEYIDIWQNCIYVLCKVHHCGHDTTETLIGAAPVTTERALISQKFFFFSLADDEDATIGASALLSCHTKPSDLLPHITDTWSEFIRNLGALLLPDSSHVEWYLSALRGLPPEVSDILKKIYPNL